MRFKYIPSCYLGDTAAILFTCLPSPLYFSYFIFHFCAPRWDTHLEKSTGANLQHNRQMSHNSNNTSSSVLPGVRLCVGTRPTLGYWVSDWINWSRYRGQTCHRGFALSLSPTDIKTLFRCADYASSVRRLLVQWGFPFSAESYL